jgi:hypothetical protein
MPVLPRSPAGDVGANDSSPFEEIVGTPELLHACFAAEGRDEAWSAAVEPQILAFFNSGARREVFDQPTVECRTSLCELHVSARVSEEAAGDVVDTGPAWNRLVNEMRRDEAFATAFDPDAVATQVEHGASITYTATLTRHASDDFAAEARCGGLEETALRTRALGPEALSRSARSRDGRVLPLPDDVVSSYFKLNEYFEAEERDAAWASAAESRIGEFLSAGALGDTFEAPSIECRETLCAIETSTDAIAASGGSMSAWQQAYHGMRESPDLELDSIASHMRTDEENPDRIEYITFVLRRR